MIHIDKLRIRYRTKWGRTSVTQEFEMEDVRYSRGLLREVRERYDSRALYIISAYRTLPDGTKELMTPEPHWETLRSTAQ